MAANIAIKRVIFAIIALAQTRKGGCGGKSGRIAQKPCAIGIGGFPPRRESSGKRVKVQVRRPVSRVLSPPVRAMDGHSSGMPVTGHLARPTRATSRKHRCRLPGVSPLFGLAPGGVCPAASVTGRAVGSYPTVSPLPAWLPSEDGPDRRFVFCGTFPGVAPAGR